MSVSRDFIYYVPDNYCNYIVVDITTKGNWLHSGVGISYCFIYRHLNVLFKLSLICYSINKPQKKK